MSILRKSCRSKVELSTGWQFISEQISVYKTGFQAFQEFEIFNDLLTAVHQTDTRSQTYQAAHYSSSRYLPSHSQVLINNSPIISLSISTLL